MSYLVRFEDDNDGWCSCQRLIIERHGEVIAEHYDGGEPEDQSFYRDWAWVAGALRQAYEFGREDGEKCPLGRSFCKTGNRCLGCSAGKSRRDDDDHVHEVGGCRDCPYDAEYRRAQQTKESS